MKQTLHELFDVWEEPGTKYPWKAQLKAWVAEHETRAGVESYVAAEKELLSRDSESKNQAQQIAHTCFSRSAAFLTDRTQQPRAYKTGLRPSLRLWY
jgi:hypothetical protein